MSSMPSSTVQFATAARVLSSQARARQLMAPAFRCPPRIVGATRSLRRYPGGAAVAVQVKGRPWGAVLGDMIEGVIAVNQVPAAQADRLRSELWRAVEYDRHLVRVA